ncbi:AAA family ATPase [Methylobacterium sp. Leaf361]|nr:AAA family ATPase [Methylobacterium sp. Leaf361]
MIAVPVVEAIKATIRENRIDVVIIDPFVSSHRAGEGSTSATAR